MAYKLIWSPAFRSLDFCQRLVRPFSNLFFVTDPDFGARLFDVGRWASHGMIDLCHRNQDRLFGERLDRYVTQFVGVTSGGVEIGR